MSCVQERLFERGEMAVSVRAFVQARMEGFELRQAARAGWRKRRAELRTGATDSQPGETQACLAFGSGLETEHKIAPTSPVDSRKLE